MEGLESYRGDIDDGLVFYKEEFVKLAVKSDATLKYLRPWIRSGGNEHTCTSSVQTHASRTHYQLQTPDSKSKLKQQCIENFCAQPKTPKRLKFGSPVGRHVSTTPANIIPERQPRSKAEAAPRAPENFLNKKWHD